MKCCKNRNSLTTAFLLHLLLFLAVAAFYATEARNLGFIYDDHEQIKAESDTLTIATVFQTFSRPHFSNSYYRPLARLLLKLQIVFSGRNAMVLHIFNCVLAGIIAALLFEIFISLLPVPTIVSWAAALATCLHPIMSSAVYMISGQEALLCAVLLMISLVMLIRQRPVIAITACLLAMLCRENAVALPLLLTLSAGIACRIRKSPLNGISRSFFAGLWAGTFAFIVLRSLILHGKSAPVFSFNPVEPGLAYIYLLQSFFWPTPELIYEPSISEWLSLQTIAAITVSIMLFWKLKKEPSFLRHGLFWFLWLLIMFLPTANIIQQQTPYDERHNLIILPALAAMMLLAAAAECRRRPALAAVVILILAVPLALCSFNRASYFKNDFAFASQWLKTNPEAGEAYALMGNLLSAKGHTVEAALMYKKSIETRPTMASSYDNLGSLLGAQGRHDDATELFRQAVTLDPENFYYRYNLAANMEARGQYLSGFIYFQLASMYTYGNNESISQQLSQGLSRTFCKTFMW